jgi:hypothetical protein
VDGVLPSDGSVERAIAVAGGATDFVEGYGGGPQIEGDAPPKRAIDLVTDGGADDPTEGTVGTDGTVRPPGQEISHPLNPQEDLLGGLSPTAGPGGNTGGGDGADNSGRVGVSNAATATDATDATPTATGSDSGVTNIGVGSSGGGINTVVGSGDDVTGAGPDDSGRASQSSAMMAGDDDDLEELDVQRADKALAGPGTQTEDEVYIGATSAPVDPTGVGADAGSMGTASADPSEAVASPSEAPPMVVATVAEVIVPVLELELDDPVPVPVDPVADAMVMDVAPFEAQATPFTVLDDEVDLSIPDEADLDDGL